MLRLVLFGVPVPFDIVNEQPLTLSVEYLGGDLLAVKH